MPSCARRRRRRPRRRRRRRRRRCAPGGPPTHSPPARQSARCTGAVVRPPDADRRGLSLDRVRRVWTTSSATRAGGRAVALPGAGPRQPAGGRAGGSVRGGGGGAGGAHRALGPAPLPYRRGGLPRRAYRGRRVGGRGCPPRGRRGSGARPGRGHRHRPAHPPAHHLLGGPDDAGGGHTGRPAAVAGQPRRGRADLRRGPQRAGRRRCIPRGVVVGPRATGRTRSPRRQFPVWFFAVAGETVWGATARTLVELVCLVVGVPLPGSLRAG